MRHVDEGTLHALLDGALRAEDPAMAAEVESHMAECEDCRARLEAATELRRDAGDILDATAPDRAAAIPPFAAVLARAERRADGPDAAIRPDNGDEGFTPVRRHAAAREIEWIRRLSWAATLVIALGTGYLIRGLVEPSEPFGDRGALTVDRERPAAVETGGAARDETTDEATKAMEPREPRAERRAMPGPSSSPDAERTATPPAARAVSSAEPEAASPAAAAPASGDASLAGTASDLSMAAAGADAGAGVSAAVPAGAEEGRWSAATPAEVRAALGGPLYLLPKATLVEVYLRVETEPAEALSLQELGSGLAVTVVQRRATVEAGEPVAQEAGVSSAEAARGDMGVSRAPQPRQSFAALPPPEKASVVVDGFVLEVTGSLPVELLAILAGAARPVP